LQYQFHESGNHNWLCSALYRLAEFHYIFLQSCYLMDFVTLCRDWCADQCWLCPVRTNSNGCCIHISKCLCLWHWEVKASYYTRLQAKLRYHWLQVLEVVVLCVKSVSVDDGEWDSCWCDRVSNEESSEPHRLSSNSSSHNHSTWRPTH